MKSIIPALFTTALVLGFAYQASAVFVDYTTVANGTYSSISLGGTTVTGSSSVVSANYAGFQGLGIAGGGSNVSLDTGETMTIALGQLGANVQLTLVDIDPPGNVTFSFQAYNGATSLGSFSFPLATVAPETYNLSSLAGGLSMTSFIISVGTPSAPLGLQIQAVSFNSSSVPDSAFTLTLLSVGILGLFVFRSRLQPQN